MEWVKCNERLPDTEQIVVIKLKYAQPIIFVARYLDNLSTCIGDFKDVFVKIVHPRFPKIWLFTPEYTKISRIPKNKVEFWMPLPEFPKGIF